MNVQAFLFCALLWQLLASEHSAVLKPKTPHPSIATFQIVLTQ